MFTKKPCIIHFVSRLLQTKLSFEEKHLLILCLMVTTTALPAVTNLTVKDYFNNRLDNQLVAQVTVENPTDFVVSCQVIFRGYVKEKNRLLYEFLYEQVWTLVSPHEATESEVSVDVWLSRFPPTMQIGKYRFVEYSVQASVNPWHQNNFIEKKFIINRELSLKMPHIASYQLRYKLNKCIGHGSWAHKKCTPLNVDIYINKGVFTQNELAKCCWFISSETKLKSVRMLLVQYLHIRDPDPGHYQLMQTRKEVLASKCIENSSVKAGECELEIPSNIPITIPMTLWNVLRINYELVVDFKLLDHKKPFVYTIPIIISSSFIKEQGRERESKDRFLFERAMDEDDDSQDDDDDDSELSDDYEDAKSDPSHSIDLHKIFIKTKHNGDLENSYAKVIFDINSRNSERLRNLRLLFRGEVRAGHTWYEFIRFKSIVSSNQTSSFSPGRHSVKISLPFAKSQLDSKILPPSIGDDIRYICCASMMSWRKNYVTVDAEVFVDRAVDTWAKQEYQNEYRDQLGSISVSMSQRCFQRGKHAYITLTNVKNIRNVRFMIMQHRRIRRPELSSNDSFCVERTVSMQPAPKQKSNWPHVWAVHIPHTIPPCIEISYWNVLILRYSLIVDVTLLDGHEHQYAIPIWIGTTDDNLEPPTVKLEPETLDRIESPDLPDLPEFEVINTDDVHIQPYWVERFNNNTYAYDVQ